MVDDEDDGRRLGFTIPPIRLPEVLFPEGLRFWVPGWISSEGNRVLAALALDSIDALVILAVGDSLVRPFVGTAVMALLHGPFGLLYAVEVIPTVLDLSLLAVVPTATILTLLKKRSAA